MNNYGLKSMFFSSLFAVLPPPVWFETLTRAFCDLGYKSWSQKITSGENCAIVFSQYQRVTDGHTACACVAL